MGRNISIYLDDEDLRWLDSICSEWQMTRGKAIQYVLRQSRAMSKMLVGFLKPQNPKLASDLKKMLEK